MFSMFSISKAPTAIFVVSFRVLVSALNLNMVKAGASNALGPTNIGGKLLISLIYLANRRGLNALFSILLQLRYSMVSMSTLKTLADAWTSPVRQTNDSP